MKWIGKYAKISIMAVLVVAFLAGCTWHPGEEDIQALEETKTAALAAEKTLADKKAERKDLEAKLAAKKAELTKVSAEKVKVMQKLEQQQATEN
jgi:septal ring factor EnvC (AmiA/AmiB activator)